MSFISSKKEKYIYTFLYGSPLERANLIKKLAARGHHHAQLIHAKKHVNETTKYSFKKNEEKGVQLFKKYAEQDNFEAQCYVVGFYEFGMYGVQKDLKKAKKLLKEYAENGNPKAQIELIKSYQTNRFSEKRQVEKAHILLKKYADQGNEVAQIESCRSMCVFGDYGKALLHYNYYAAKGNHRAQCELGKFYMIGLCGVQKDVQQALGIYKNYAEEGNIDASYVLLKYYAFLQFSDNIDENLTDDVFEKFLHYATQIIANVKFDFAHPQIHNLHRSINSLIRKLFSERRADNYFARLINSHLRPFFNMRKKCIYSYRPIIDNVCSHGSKMGR